jgi:hypothetical protein
VTHRTAHSVQFRLCLIWIIHSVRIISLNSEKDTGPCMMIELLPFLTEHMHQALTTKHFDVSYVWFVSCPPIIRTYEISITCSRWQALSYVVGITHSLTPELMVQFRVRKHTPCFVQNTSIESLSDSIGLRTVGSCHLQYDSLTSQVLFKCLVLSTSVTLHPLDDGVVLLLKSSLERLECIFDVPFS